MRQPGKKNYYETVVRDGFYIMRYNDVIIDSKSHNHNY